MDNKKSGTKEWDLFCGDYNRIGKGFVKPCKVRVYHRFWGLLAPAKIALDWNDDDAMPFVYYYDLKGRIMFGSSDEQHVHLFDKMERCRFEYTDIYFVGRLWTKRKIIVIDQLSGGNMKSKYTYFREFMKIAKQYVENIDEYKLVFLESEDKNDVCMNTINEVREKCVTEFIHTEIKHCTPVGGKRKWNIIDKQSDEQGENERVDRQ